MLAPAALLGTLFFMLAAGPLGIRPSDTVYFTQAGIVGVLGAITLAFAFGRVPERWSHAGSAAILALPLIITMVGLWATGEEVFAVLLVALIASGGVLLHTGWLGAMLIGTNAAAIPLLLSVDAPHTGVVVCALVLQSGFALLVHLLMRGALLRADQLAQRLATSEASFRTLVETSPDAMFVHAAGEHDFEICWVNDSMVQLLGYDNPDQLVGRRSIDTFVHPADHDKLIEFRTRLQSDADATLEIRWCRRDGSTRYIQATARPTMFDGERSILVVARDMTEQLEREREREVAEAAIRSSEEQLRHSQRLEAVGQLAGGVAHDFNNLLAVILANASSITDELGKGHAVASDLGEISAAAERAAGLTRQLLAFGRKQRQHVTMVTLDSVVASFERMLSRVLSEDIEIRTVLDAELGTIRADPAQLEQILMNLIVNARDAMPNGGTLTIETTSVDLDAERAFELGLRPGGYVQLLVADTGCGMSAEVRAHVFEPFYTTKEVGKGSGLGLSTVFGIVKQSEGAITCESEVGRGTRFRILLPRVAGVVKPLPEKPQVAAKPGSETILLVEDDPLLRSMLKRQLRKLGYRVLQAQDGATALEIAEVNPEPIDLLLTDLVMPGMDGRALARRLVESRPTTKVLFMSGYTEHPAVKSAAFTADDVLVQKPFTAAELSSAIRSVLDAPSRVTG